MPDVDRWVELGLYDPTAATAADRHALLVHLTEVGITEDEMVASHAEGRLFALTGDRIIRSGPRLVSLAEAAARLGTDVAFLQRAWRACGLSPLAEEGPALSEGDVDALAVVVTAATFFGESQALGVTRVASAGLARLAEAETAMLFGIASETNLDHSHSELVTAQAYGAIATLVPAIGRQLDMLHRHHIEASRRHFESVEVSPDTGSVRLSVGFADLTGFTELSAARPLPYLSKLLAGFEERASETVHAGGGRIVKFLGDAVMFVGSTPAIVAGIALDLVHDEMAAEIGILVRAGVAAGSMVVQDGDYFGPPVNLAARLVSVAAPTSVLADPSMRDALDVSGFAVAEQAPVVLRGIAEPVAPLAVSR